MAAVMIHEQFENDVANKLARKAAPYLKMMRSVVMVAKFTVTCAELPIPFAIPNFPDIVASYIVSNIKAVEIFSARMISTRPQFWMTDNGMPTMPMK